MQVVRLARKGRPRTLAEKAVEALLALRLSLSLSKRQVLGLYAAYAPFGGNTVGLDAAAWRYFGREAGQLSWAETAALAVLPNAPRSCTRAGTAAASSRSGTACSTPSARGGRSTR
jgi:penicillin-binding protein 1C